MKYISTTCSKSTRPHRGRNVILFYIWLYLFCFWLVSVDNFFFKGTHPFGKVIHTLLTVVVLGIPFYGLVSYLTKLKRHPLF